MADTSTAADAITAALCHNWKEAIRVNTLILKVDTTNIAALNRLGYAYAQNNQFNLAKTTFQKVLKLDPYNQIAFKHTKKLGKGRQKLLPQANLPRVSPLMFIEEPGITKIVAGVNLAPAQTLATLSPGMEVILKSRNHCVEIRSTANTYIAALPDDIAFKLLKLIASGNRYQAIIKSVEKKSLMILLRELSRGKRFADQPSFTPVSVALSPIPHSAIDRAGDKPNVTTSGEAEDTEDQGNNNENPTNPDLLVRLE